MSESTTAGASGPIDETNGKSQRPVVPARHTAPARTPLWQPSWDLRPHSIPKQRYTDVDFAHLEAERLWPKVWQMGCRIEEIPNPGDYTVFDIVDQSVLIVRVDPQTIKAFHNVCPHRATQLAVGCGNFAGRRIVCPFHGWAWKLAGENDFVLDRHEFRGGALPEGEPRLRECQVDTWLGCVFVNLDPDAAPFDQHVAAVRDYLDPLLIGEMRFHWHKRVVLRANWKIAQEAFLEGYHTPGTHPQLVTPLSGPTHEAIHYEVFDGGHAAFNSRGPRRKRSVAPPDSDPLEALISGLSLLAEGLEAMALPGDVALAKSLRDREIPAGSSPGGAFIAELYERAKASGRPLPEPTSETLMKWGGQCFVFPNFFVLPQFGNALIYRSRPDGFDPDSCIYDVWSVTTYPADETPPPPTVQDVDPQDPASLPLIPRQDFSNIPRIQRGLHSRGFEASLLSERQEISIPHMHRELDRYLKGA